MTFTKVFLDFNILFLEWPQSCFQMNLKISPNKNLNINLQSFLDMWINLLQILALQQMYILKSYYSAFSFVFS